MGKRGGRIPGCSVSWSRKRKRNAVNKRNTLDVAIDDDEERELAHRNNEKLIRDKEFNCLRQDRFKERQRWLKSPEREAGRQRWALAEQARLKEAVRVNRQHLLFLLGRPTLPGETEEERDREIENYTSRTREAEAAWMRVLIDPFSEVLMEEIERHGGAIPQYRPGRK